MPDKFIVAQWRECIAIKRQWEKGTLKHRLVSYVMDYGKPYFFVYVTKVTEELQKRNIKFQNKYFEEFYQFCIGEDEKDKIIVIGELHYPEHNDRYLNQCIFNLQEKFDRGIITLDEWDKIVEKFGGYSE